MRTIYGAQPKKLLLLNILDTPAKPMERVKGMAHGLDVPRHMLEHIYPFPGGTAPVIFRVTVVLDTMRRWAVQYAVHAWVLSPERLAEPVREGIETTAGYYRQRKG